MNHSTTSRTRLLCRIYRLWATVRGGQPPAHARECADCRSHFSATDQFDNRLRRDARSRDATIPDGLEQRIMQTILPAVRARRTSPVRTGWFILAGAGAAACAAIALAWVTLRTPDAPPLMVQDEPGSAATVAAGSAAPTWSALGERLRDSVAPATSTLTGQNPLQQEIEYVYADTRSALRFLARNFLPSVPEGLAPDESLGETSS